jgi:hypothetical protein
MLDVQLVETSQYVPQQVTESSSFCPHAMVPSIFTLFQPAVDENAGELAGGQQLKFEPPQSPEQGLPLYP